MTEQFPSSVEQNKVLALRVVEEVWNHGNLTILDELFQGPSRSTGADHHSQSVEQIKQTARLYRALAPDLHTTIDQVIAEKDSVMVRWTARGTHTGAVQGITSIDALSSGQDDGRFHLRLLRTLHPDGRQVSFDGVTVLEFTDNKLTSVWLLFDAVAVLRKLGALPAAGPGN